MKQFVILSVLLVFSLPVGFSIAGCKGTNPNNYCNKSGYGYGLKTNAVAAITPPWKHHRHLARLWPDRPVAGPQRHELQWRRGIRLHLCVRQHQSEPCRRLVHRRPLRRHLEPPQPRRNSRLHHLHGANPGRHRRRLLGNDLPGPDDRYRRRRHQQHRPDMGSSRRHHNSIVCRVAHHRRTRISRLPLAEPDLAARRHRLCLDQRDHSLLRAGRNTTYRASLTAQ